MAPKAKIKFEKRLRVKTEILPPPVDDKDVNKAEELPKNKEVKEKCKQSMYYALLQAEKKGDYDQIDLKARQRYALCWAASQLVNTKIFGVHTKKRHRRMSATRSEWKKKKKWRGKQAMINEMGLEKAEGKIAVFNENPKRQRPDPDSLSL